MGKLKSILDKLRWYFTNLPVVTTALFIVIIICYKIRLERHFADVSLCVQPHMVMTGQVSRLIKYIVHHKNVNNLVLSLVSLAIFGTVAERNAGSLRYLFLMMLFAVLSACLTVFFSILLGFSSRYSSLMYSCPALGLTPALFSMTVLVFKSLPMKKTVLLFCIVPNLAIPWLLLIFSQFVLQDTTFISNLSGCIIGSLYICSLKNVLTLPSSLVQAADGILTKVFRFIPIIRYIPGTAIKLPLYSAQVPESGRAQYQPFDVPDDCPVPIVEGSAAPHKVEKMVQMGFTKENSIVALTASSGDIDQAVSILAGNQIGNQASVLPSKSAA